MPINRATPPFGCRPIGWQPLSSGILGRISASKCLKRKGHPAAGGAALLNLLTFL